jgi:hypothetical protein
MKAIILFGNKLMAYRGNLTLFAEIEFSLFFLNKLLKEQECLKIKLALTA